MSGNKSPNHWGLFGLAAIIVVVLVGIGLLLA